MSPRLKLFNNLFVISVMLSAALFALTTKYVQTICPYKLEILEFYDEHSRLTFS